MAEPISAMILGGLFRLIPDWLNKKAKADELKHEREMLKLQFDLDVKRSELKLQEIREDNSGKISLAEIQTMTEAIKAQGQLTGVKWVDALNSSLRPVLTYWWVGFMYSGVVVSKIYLLISSGIPLPQALVQMWTSDEMALVNMMATFFFVGRSIDKRK